jgi:hypothetical protein
MYAPASGGTSRSFATVEPDRVVWPADGVAAPGSDKGIA